MINIEVDYSKCLDANECLKCLNVCPSGVLLVLTPFFEIGIGKIKPAFLSMCTGCRECQKICPKGAVTVLNK